MTAVAVAPEKAAATGDVERRVVDKTTVEALAGAAVDDFGAAAGVAMAFTALVGKGSTHHNARGIRLTGTRRPQQLLACKRS